MVIAVHLESDNAFNVGQEPSLLLPYEYLIMKRVFCKEL